MFDICAPTLALCSLSAGCLMLSQVAGAQENRTDTQELAKKLANPVSALISVPFQFNYDHNIGLDDEGERFQLNFQPVVPISLGSDWKVISRTIVPIIYQNDVVPPPLDDDQFGLGDVEQSLFFSPQQAGSGGLIWGIGPVTLLRTATDDLLGSENWAIGPTGVVVFQRNHFTVGVLANHLWSVGGNEERTEVNATFIQPFFSYTTADAWTFTLNSEATYDWEAKTWSVPINAQATKLFKIGKQPISIGGGLRYWAETPQFGPEGIGVRLIVTFLFPE
jgi:hypothetical protein